MEPVQPPTPVADATAAKTTTIRLPPDSTFSTQLPPPTPILREEKLTLPPTTTEQEDLTTSGQRLINLIWEFTQALIAVIVVGVNMYVGASLALAPSGKDMPSVLQNTLFLVVGFYFSRTNHAAVGGVGAKPNPKYEGR